MNTALVLAGLAMGVAASPHCASMCATPCAALTHGGGRSAAGFHAGRLLGYMAGGALAAASVAALGTWSQAAPAFKPLWTLLHTGFLALGLWWLATGRQPAWMRRDAVLPVTGSARVEMPVRRPVAARGPVQAAADMRALGGIGNGVGGWGGPGIDALDAGPARRAPLRSRALRASAAGLAWVAWPCAALQAALMLAALANDALGGALVMAAFATGSMPALAVAPWAWGRWHAWRGTPATSRGASALGLRVAGFGLVIGSGWALTHGLWAQVAAWCLG